MTDPITLSHPISADEVRAAFPRALAAVGDTELEVWVETAEYVIRSQFNVTRRDAESDEALRRAVVAAWPSFMQQVRNVSTESSSAEGHSVTYARGERDTFAFPAIVSTILRRVTDDADAPTTTELVR